MCVPRTVCAGGSVEHAASTVADAANRAADNLAQGASTAYTQVPAGAAAVAAAAAAAVLHAIKGGSASNRHPTAAMQC